MESCLRPNTKNIFNKTINWKNIWQTLNLRFIQNYDYDVIYKRIENSIAVWKQLSDWKTESTSEICVLQIIMTQSCMYFSTTQ